MGQKSWLGLREQLGAEPSEVGCAATRLVRRVHRVERDGCAWMLNPPFLVGWVLREGRRNNSPGLNHNPSISKALPL